MVGCLVGWSELVGFLVGLFVAGSSGGEVEVVVVVVVVVSLSPAPGFTGCGFGAGTGAKAACSADIAHAPLLSWPNWHELQSNWEGHVHPELVHPASQSKH